MPAPDSAKTTRMPAISRPTIRGGKHRRSFRYRFFPKDGSVNLAGASRDASELLPIVVAWMLALSTGLFLDEVFPDVSVGGRWSGDLLDPSLIRQTPVAYLALALGVAVLGWIFDRIDLEGAVRGAVAGGILGVAASLAVISRSISAEEIGWLPVVSASLVHMIEFGCAGACLGVYRGTSLPRRTLQLVMTVALVMTAVSIVAGP